MKALLLVLSMLLASVSFAQQFEAGFTPDEKQVIGKRLLEESDNPDNTKEERNFFASLAEKFVNFSEKSTSTPFRRRVGKIASAITTQTARPFMYSSAFLTGLFEKNPNEKTVAFLNFFLAHEPRFREIPKNTATIEELSDAIYAEVDAIILEKQNIIIVDILKQIGATNIDLSDLSKVVVTPEQLEKIQPEMVNEHPEFQDIRPIVGDFTKERIVEVIEDGEFSLDLDLEEISKTANIRIHEIVLTSISQVVIGAKVIGIVSGALGTIYGVTVGVADVISGMNVTACMFNDNVQKKLTEDKDKDLRNFCSYVAVQSAYTLARSRARGYVKGKSFRVKVERTVDKLKNKLNKNKKTEQVM